MTDPDPGRYSHYVDDDDDTDSDPPEAEIRDDEPTQVTKLLSGMKEVVFEQCDRTKDMGDKADRVSRLARRPKSVQGLRAVSALPPEPSTSSGG